MLSLLVCWLSPAQLPSHLGRTLPPVLRILLLVSPSVAAAIEYIYRTRRHAIKQLRSQAAFAVVTARAGACTLLLDRYRKLLLT